MDDLNKALEDGNAGAAADALNVLSAGYTEKWTGQGPPPADADRVRAALAMPEAAAAAVALLRKLLSADDASTVLQARLPLLDDLMTHALPDARRLALDALAAAVSKDLDHAERWDSVLVKAAAAVGDEEMQVAYAAVRLFKGLAAKPTGSRVLFAEPVLAALQQQSTRNETVEMRVLELFVKLGAASPQALQQVAATKAIKPLLDNLNSPREDVLWNLNALELLKRLLVTAHGFDYLATFNILEYLAGFVGQLASGQVDPMTASVLAPAVLEALGSVWRIENVDFEALEAERPFATALAALVLQTENVGAKHAAMSALFDLSSHASGMRVMLNHRPALSSLGAFGAAGENPELQTHVVGGVAATLARQTADSALAEEYFALYAASGRPLDARLMDMLASPFQDLQLAAFDFACGLARHAWGQKRLMQQPGFLEFATGNGGGSAYKVRLARFELAKAMAQADGVLDAPQLMKFKRVVREGPFASNAEPGVAVGAEDA